MNTENEEFGKSYFIRVKEIKIHFVTFSRLILI